MDRQNRSASFTDPFDKIFHPRRVAVLGVSQEGFGFGRAITSSLLAIGFDGEIFPVNPRGGETLGLKVYRSVDEIPGGIDFAVITLPAKLVPGALEECRQKGAAGAEILSAGFRETGTPEGMALEEDIKSVSRRGIRVIGPNCFGIYCPRSGLTLIPGPDLSRESGGVAFLSQSGGMSIDFAHLGGSRGLRFSKVVSYGNGADLREIELLRYLGDDPETGVIAMYIEGVENGREFFRTLREVSERKPVIIYKGGLSDAGRRAVASHTASMGGTRNIWESMLRQCNAVQVYDLEEMTDACLAFTMLPGKAYRGLTVAGGGGALGVAAADYAEAFGLAIPPLRADLQESILPLLPRPGSSASNPIDVANPFVPPETLKQMLSISAGDANIDIQVLIQLLYHYKSLTGVLGAASVRDITPSALIADAASDVVKETGTPLVMVLPNPKRDADSIEVEQVTRETKLALLRKGVPVFDGLREAMRAIGSVSRYHARLEGRNTKNGAGA